MSTTAPAAEPVALKRSLSLPLVVLYGLGNILGAGIYVLIGEVAGRAGYLAPLSFVLAALTVVFTAFSYAELTSRFPVSAGEAVYVQEGFGRVKLSVLVGLLVAFAGMFSAATISKGFVGYLQLFISMPAAMAIVLVVLALGALAAWGISESVMVAALLTLFEILGLLLILWVGYGDLLTLPARLDEIVGGLDKGGSTGVLLGAFLAFFAFIGFEDMVNVAEEVKHPRRNLPLAIFISLLVSGALYVSIATVAVLVVAPEDLAASNAPLALVYQQATGRPAIAIGLISVVAVINGALIQIIMASRLLYGMGRNGWLPAALAYVHPRRQTPIIATAVVAVTIICLALFAPLLTLASLTSLALLAVFALINLALIRIKHRQVPGSAVRSYPLWVPVLGVITSIAMASFSLILLLE